MNALLTGIVVVLCVRTLQFIVFSQVMWQVPDEAEQDREGHAQPLSLLAGFSLAAVTAIASQDPVQPFGKALDAAKASLLWSFLFQLSALNLQHYKTYRCQDLVGGGLSDLAMFTLAVGAWQLAAVTLNDHANQWVTYVLIVVLIGFDRTYRFTIEWQVLSGLKHRRERNGQKTIS